MEVIEGTCVDHGELGIAGARHAQMGDHPPSEPDAVDVLARGVDPSGHLPARDGRQRGERKGERAGVPGTDRRVDEVDTGGRHGDPHLAGCGRRVVDLLIAKVVRGAELVEDDGVHDGDRTTSSELAVMGAQGWPPTSHRVAR